MVPVSRRLGRFEIREKLGRGGMADVYLALDTAGGFPVALKIIEHSQDPDVLDSIDAERRGSLLQARLADSDPHAVRAYDAGDIETYFFVAMEYVEGRDLHDILRAGPMPPEEACRIALDVCRTLQHAHSLEMPMDGKVYHGIVHGDIKPKNVRIDPTGRARILDFGIAKALTLSRRLTRNEFGSVPYASPERLDRGEVNRHSDLWSLAVMLYEMVTGLQPYHAETTERLERMILSRVPPPPAPDPCPEPLRRILMKALEPDPAARYATAADFAADLEAFLAGRDIVAPAVALDSDATRRTFRPLAADSDATRRTAPAVAVPAPPPPAVPAPPKRGLRIRLPQTTRPLLVVFGVIAFALLAWGTYAVATNYIMWSRGRQLSADIAAEHVTDPAAIWDRWTELSHGHSSSFLLWGARRAVRRQLVDSATATINSYRSNDARPIYEKEWERARLYLTRALDLDSGDDTVRGELRLVEGHIARINGTSHRSTDLLNQAVQKFNEAQRLMPKSPDPELGLARVYVYGLKDIDKAYAALREAEHRGFKLGNREQAQLADGYRDRADRLWWDSRNVRGLPQEQAQIQRAADDYKRALELYQSIVPYLNANASIIRVQQSLDSVNFRLKQLQEGAPFGINPQ